MNPLSSVGTGELILILVVALIFLGPERLPEIARSLGKAIRQLRNALQNMSSEFGEELASVQEVTQDLQEGVRAVRDVRNLSQTLVSSAAAPLVQAVEPVKSALQEAKEAVETGPALSPAQGEAESVAALEPEETEETEETEELEEPGETEENEEKEPGPSGERRVVIEDDQV